MQMHQFETLVNAGKEILGMTSVTATALYISNNLQLSGFVHAMHAHAPRGVHSAQHSQHWHGHSTHVLMEFASTMRQMLVHQHAHPQEYDGNSTAIVHRAQQRGNIDSYSRLHHAAIPLHL